MSVRSGLDEWRRLVFRWAGVHAAAESAVAHAIQKVDGQSDDQPNDESSPRLQGQTEHEDEAEQNPEKRKNWNQRDTKRAGPSGIFTAQNDHT